MIAIVDSMTAARIFSLTYKAASDGKIRTVKVQGGKKMGIGLVNAYR